MAIIVGILGAGLLGIALIRMAWPVTKASGVTGAGSLPTGTSLVSPVDPLRQHTSKSEPTGQRTPSAVEAVSALLVVLRRLESLGAIDTAAKLREYSGKLLAEKAEVKADPETTPEPIGFGLGREVIRS